MSLAGPYSFNCREIAANNAPRKPMDIDPLDTLRSALRDIRLGALMMQDPTMSPDLRRYASEVERISHAALDAAQLGARAA